jgi:hypothetical protein
MASASDFTKLVPGFDFLQGLMKNAGASLPNMGQWIAPTLDPEELEKRIGELKTVQFWLEQNAKLLGATIQAMEVQRMTLTTLRTMNLPMAKLRESLEIKPGAGLTAVPSFGMGDAAPARPEPAKAAPEPEPEPEAEAEPEAAAPAPGKGGKAAKGGEHALPSVVDPMQWWGALTQQFTELAASALKDSHRPPVEASGQLMSDPKPAKAPARKRSAPPARKRGAA